MIEVLTIIHAIVSVLIVVLVLLQFGKGAEAGLFTGGGEGAMFTGAQKGNLLTRATTVLAVLFLGISVALASLQSHSTGQSTVFDEETAPVSAPRLNDEALNQGEETQDKTTAPAAPSTEGTSTAP